MKQASEQLLDLNRAFTDTPEAFSQGVHRRLATLPRVDKKTALMRIRPAFLLTTALLVCFVGIALAVRLTDMVGWNGQPMDISSPDLHATPAPTNLGEGDWDAYMGSLIDAKAEDEYWIARHGESAAHGEPSQTFSSLHAGIAPIRASGLRIWDAVPAGYTFVRLKVWFYLTQQDLASATLIATENKEQDVVLDRYRLPETIRNQVRRYALVVENQSGLRLTLHGERESASAEHGFGTLEGMPYEAVPVTGMENALYINRHDLGLSILYLLETNAPVRAHALFDHLNAVEAETVYFDTAVYELEIDTLAREELIALAEALR